MNRKRKSSDLNETTNDRLNSPGLSDKKKIIKKQRIMAFSGSYATANDEDDEDEFNRTLRPRSRRKCVPTAIASDSDEPIIIEEISSPVKPRKKTFRRCEIADEDLEAQTKRAMREQKERDDRLRIQHEREEAARLERLNKQKEYNGTILDEHERNQLPVAFELVLETDPNSGEILIEVDLMLVQYMKKHQVEGVRFLWNQVFESTQRIAQTFDPQSREDRGGSGAILAHCMGLGKTFTTISLIHTLFRHSALTHIHRVLILCPLNTASNWKNEFHHWIGDLKPVIPVHFFNADEVSKKNRVSFLRRWYNEGGILIMGYEMYRILNYASDSVISTPKKKRPGLDEESSSDSDGAQKKESADLALVRTYRKYLRAPGPDLIICDEGHIIKNPRSGIARMVNEVRTLRRIVLTGTPMQNNLREYYAMINFCKPNYLGSEHEFSRNFRLPIEAGQHKDSSPSAVAHMRRRAFALNQRLRTILHRRDFDVLRSFLPPKFEYAVKIRCLPLQQELYRSYLLIQDIDPSARLNMAKLLGDYQYLMKIWTHPWLLKPHFIDGYQKYIRGQDQVKTDHFFQDGSESEDDDEARSTTKKKKVTSRYFDKSQINHKQSLNAERMDVVLKAMKKEWWYDMFDVDRAEYDIELSGKLELLRAILNECESIGDKLLVFTRSLLALDYIEKWLDYWSSRASSPKWVKGRDYFRMDGKVSIKQRAADVASFNDENNGRARLFLISTTAGGIGINLYSANRVIIFDVSWNPAHDLQAMFRAYRLGQKKPVYVYRIIGKGTMEEKIYKRQITKQAMSQRVIDAKQLDRHFTNDELAQLYRFEPDDDNDPLDKYDADRVKDKVLRHLLDQFPDLIVSFREHDSLLIHRDEENLTEAERRQAQAEDEVSNKRIYGRQLTSSSTSSDDSVIPIIPGEAFEFLRRS